MVILDLTFIVYFGGHINSSWKVVLQSSVWLPQHLKMDEFDPKTYVDDLLVDGKSISMD